MTGAEQPVNNLAEQVLTSRRLSAAVYEICALLASRPQPHDEASQKWDDRVEAVLNRIKGGP